MLGICICYGFMKYIELYLFWTVLILHCINVAFRSIRVEVLLTIVSELLQYLPNKSIIHVDVRFVLQGKSVLRSVGNTNKLLLVC